MAVKESVLSPISAYEALEDYVGHHGLAALELAMHASVPESLRVDMVALLRRNFLPPEHALRTDLDADLLFALFCEYLGGGYFRLDPEVRRQLVDHLAEAHLGEARPRVERVAAFLLAYVDHMERRAYARQDRLLRAYLETQRWVALAFLSPDAAAEQLAGVLEQAMGEPTSGARLRLGSVASVLSLPLAHYRPLLDYALGVDAIEGGDRASAEYLLGTLGNRPVSLGPHRLPAPIDVLRRTWAYGGAEQGTDKIGSRGAINVFISNAIEDHASAQDLYGALKKPGIEPWLDNLPPLEGELFVDANEEEIKGSDCLIALLSRHSVDPAGHVQKEWRLARDTEGITFIAIRVEEHTPPEEFADMHWMDLFPSDKEAYKEGLRKLLRLLYRIKRVAWFEESFSSFGPDNEGWELGEWELVSDDNTGIGSESMYAKASLSPSKPLPQTVTKTASVSLELGDSKALEYARKLDLSVYLGNAAFQVIIDDGAAHVIDEEAHTQDYKENKWTRRKLPLARYATERVTLKFVLSVTGKMNYMAHAAAWVDDIRILGEADIETVAKRSFFTPRDSRKYLKLVAEEKLANLLENVKKEKTLEASGVVVREKDILVVMDCIKGIGRLEGQNVKDPLGKGKIVGSQRENHGYEAITRDPKTGHLFLMTEALEHGVKIQAKLAELDADLGSIGEESLDFDLPSETRGFEGAAVVRHNGNMLLLALCEGNSCAGGDLGKQKGNGLIQVFEKKKNSWGHIGRIKLPKKANFEDYADIAVRGKQVAIVSQAESALWVGTIALSSLKISGNGRVYRFPLDKNDKCVYCNVEGVDWLADDRVIVVSNRMKTGDQPGRCAEKDRSIHIMNIPG